MGAAETADYGSGIAAKSGPGREGDGSGVSHRARNERGVWDTDGNRSGVAAHIENARRKLMEPEFDAEDVLVENGHAPPAATWIQEHSPLTLWRSVFRE